MCLKLPTFFTRLSPVHVVTLVSSMCGSAGVCVYKFGYTGVMRAQKQLLQQGKTPQLDAPHSIWRTLSPRSLSSPLIHSLLNLSNTLPLLSSSQVTADCCGARITSAARLLLNEPWHAARVDGVCEEMTETGESGEKTLYQNEVITRESW